MPFRIGPTELIIVLVIIMIVFGVGKLPQVGGAVGKAIREFRRGVSLEEENAQEIRSAPRRKAPGKVGTGVVQGDER